MGVAEDRIVDGLNAASICGSEMGHMRSRLEEAIRKSRGRRRGLGGLIKMSVLMPIVMMLVYCTEWYTISEIY